MRHLYGAVLAVVLAAAVFFAGSWGYIRLGQVGMPATSGSLFSDHTILYAMGALLGTGLLAGLLIAIPWVSPLASGLPGLVLLGWTGLYLGNVHDALRFIPLKDYDYGLGFQLLLINGVLALAGLAMVIPMFVPSRWVRPSIQSALLQPSYDGQGAMPDALTETYQQGFASPAGFTSPGSFANPDPAPGNSGLFSDWSQTSPQPPVDPPRRSQAPWGPADYQ
jgi:hypothetical protein